MGRSAVRACTLPYCSNNKGVYRWLTKILNVKD